jgi:hypothetical protein
MRKTSSRNEEAKLVNFDNFGAHAKGFEEPKSLMVSARSKTDGDMCTGASKENRIPFFSCQERNVNVVSIRRISNNPFRSR